MFLMRYLRTFWPICPSFSFTENWDNVRQCDTLVMLPMRNQYFSLYTVYQNLKKCATGKTRYANRFGDFALKNVSVWLVNEEKKQQQCDHHADLAMKWKCLIISSSTILFHSLSLFVSPHLYLSFKVTLMWLHIKIHHYNIEIVCSTFN